VFSKVKSHLFHAFPDNATMFMDSIQMRVIQKLSASLFMVPCSRSHDIKLKPLKREVDKIIPVFHALSVYSFSGEATPSSPEVEFGGFAVKKKKPSQKMMKRQRKTTSQPLDPKPFEDADWDVPEDQEDANQLVYACMLEMQVCLRVRICSHAWWHGLLTAHSGIPRLDPRSGFRQRHPRGLPRSGSTSRAH
jgi:hypothetical protein